MKKKQTLNQLKKMTFWLLTLWLSMSYNVLFGQNMSGEWNGVLRQEVGGAASAYYFQLNLQQEGEIITGTSKVYFVEKPQYYAVMELRGTFKDDILRLNELKIKEEQVFGGLEWCVKKMSLKFTFQKDGFCINGTWSGTVQDGSPCVPGTIKMCKMVPIAAVF